MARPIRVGTRGSELALRQTQEVVSALRSRLPQREFEVRVIATGGDRDQAAPVAALGRGVFVKELQAALVAGEVDVAVHSLKDLPTEPVEGLSVAAVGARQDPRDVLVSRDGHGLMGLPAGARVGTGSPRRAALLRAARPDLQVMGLRGNVPTRLRKLDAGDYDAIVVAAAGMARLGLLDRVTEFLPPELFPPAPGQGAVAVEVRRDDDETRAIIAAVDDPPTRAAVTAERAFLWALGGGCNVPIGAYAHIQGATLVLRGVIATEDGTRAFWGQASGPASDPEALGHRLSETLLRMGAAELVERARV